MSKSRENKLRLAVLLSGNGTTLENLLEQSADGRLHAEVMVVVSSRAKAFGLERARRRHVPAVSVERKDFSGPDAMARFSDKIFAAVAPHHPDLVCCAGFMSRLKIPPDYEGRIINIHPALLPDFGGKGFYGHHVHEAVLQAGCRHTGCTVHFVDDEYDHGPVIAQQEVPILPGDTPEVLAARVQAAERELYPKVINDWGNI